ncbi:hypothetical protein BsWGS_28175 [Bradybaena similaris]
MQRHHRLSSILLALALCYASARTSDPEVHTPAGRFRGKILTSHSGHEYASYRGIPYALPPTGDRRFALPVRHPVIEGVHDAREFGSMCLQHSDGVALGEEDCLFSECLHAAQKHGVSGRETEESFCLHPWRWFGCWSFRSLLAWGPCDQGRHNRRDNELQIKLVWVLARQFRIPAGKSGTLGPASVLTVD